MNDVELIESLPDARIGHLIRAARHGAGLRRTVVARAAGISRTALRSAEHGTQRLDATTVVAVFSACGTTARAIVPPRRLPSVNGGVVQLGPTHHGAPSDDPDAVLAAYVAAVRAARRVGGAPLPTPRRADLEVLSNALGLDDDALVARIERIVGDRTDARTIADQLLQYARPVADAVAGRLTAPPAYGA